MHDFAEVRKTKDKMQRISHIDRREVMRKAMEARIIEKS